jgi:hypothetical protein
MEPYFPDDVDYMLFNHGAVTPISRAYHQRITQLVDVRYLLLLCALPGLIAAMIIYRVKAWDEAEFRSVATDFYLSPRWLFKIRTDPIVVSAPRFFRSLLFPREDDPILTSFGKLCWLILLAALFVPGLRGEMGSLLGTYPLPEAPLDAVSRSAEQFFVEHIWRLYAVAAVLAFLLALIGRPLHRPRASSGVRA